MNTFPRLLGGIQNTTTLLTLDIDPTAYNIAVGGGSLDPDLFEDTSYLPNPIIMYLDASGFWKWSVVLQGAYLNYVQNVKFKGDGTELIASFDSSGTSPFYLVVLSAANGSIISTYSLAGITSSF